MDYLACCQLYADQNEGILICCRCQHALAVTNSQVTSHLRDKHNVPQNIRQGLTHYLKHQHPISFRNPADLDIRPDGYPPHPKLTVYDGFACRKCSYRTINYSEIARHVSKEHTKAVPCGRTRVGPSYDEVYLQTWTKGPLRKYWIVEKDGSIFRAVLNQKTYEHLQSIVEREITRDTEQYSKNTAESSSTATFALSGPWMNRTQWETIYNSYQRDILRRLTEIPSTYRTATYALRLSTKNDIHPEIVSSAEDERKISILLGAVDCMLDRCEETARKTGRSLLCWLRSTEAQTCSKKPFAFVSLPQSRTRYRRTWKRFFAFIFRASRIPPTVRQPLTGIRFKKEQLRQIQDIWEHMAWSEINFTLGRWPEELAKHSSTNDQFDMAEDNGSGKEDWEDWEASEESESEDEHDKQDNNNTSRRQSNKEDIMKFERDIEGSGSCASDMTEDDDEEEDNEEEDNAVSNKKNTALCELLELVFQLSMTFSTEDFTNSQPSSTLLVYFSGILGFSSDSKSYLNAKDFTPFTSGIIYIQRLLFLEYALPLRAYHSLGIPQRSKKNQYETFDRVRREYMITGCHSPLAEIQSLYSFGRVMARTDPPSFFFRWSNDDETISYDDKFSLSMEKFRRLSQYFITEAEGLCESLMFGLSPVIDLANTKDEITNSQFGFSFVQHPDNHLRHAYLQLATRACTVRQGQIFSQKGWNWKAVYLYIQKVDRFLEMLAGSVHTTGGQVSRASELFSLQCRNGESTQRGVYVYNGSVVLISRHHKAKLSTNREFNVARFLPIRAGQLVYQYLVYIRPFLLMLQRERCSSSGLAILTPSNHPLFGIDGLECSRRNRLWHVSRFTSIMKKATIKVWGVPVHTRLYRQLSISITEKHVKEIHTPFNRFDDRSATADKNVVFAWQSGHRPLQQATTYGLDGAFPTTLQPALLRIYEWASTRWHEFLQQPSRKMDQYQSYKPAKMIANLPTNYCDTPKQGDILKRKSIDNEEETTQFMTKRRVIPTHAQQTEQKNGNTLSHEIKSKALLLPLSIEQRAEVDAMLKEWKLITDEEERRRERWSEQRGL